MVKESYYWMQYFYKKGSKVEDLDFIAFQFLCLLHILNICTLMMIVSHIINFDLRQWESVKFEIAYGSVFIIEVFYYFYLYKRRITIFEKFEKFTERRRKFGAVCFRIYEVATYLAFALVIINTSK